MNSTILQLVCAPCAAVLAAVWIFAALNEKGINPFYEIFGRYRKQSLLGLLLIPILVLKAIGFGSNKTPTNDVPGGGSAPTNAPPLTMAWPRPLTPEPPFESGFTSNELAAGYALWRTGTNEVWNFDLMPEAHVVEAWRLRGAAEDWAVCATTNLGPVVMTTDGRLVTTNGVFTAYDGLLALVPEANWGLLGTNAPSRAWWAETPWESTVFTWQNAFLGRDTNVPVSVQAEFTSEGDFIYRYDLSRADTNLTSELYYRIRPEDLEREDRDGDGISTHDEVTVYHTDPGLVDSDGDGIPDGDEVAAGTDPSVRSVPNADILARVAESALSYESGSLEETTPLVSMKLWDGFAADWPAGCTNFVYERTLDLGTFNGWQCYFLSSEDGAAGGWDLRGLELEWDDGCGLRGAATASPKDDSYALPLTNAVVTIRLRATGPKIRCPKPMYLVGYAPQVTYRGGRRVRDGDGAERAILLLPTDTNLTVSVEIARPQRPCNAPLYPHELGVPALAGLAAGSDGAFRYSGGPDGGEIVADFPSGFRLPVSALDAPATSGPGRVSSSDGGEDGGAGGLWIVFLDPSVVYGGAHVFTPTRIDGEGDRYFRVSGFGGDPCTWAGFQETWYGTWLCSCVPEVSAGELADGLPFVTTDCEVDGETATGFVYMFGTLVWTGEATHAWRDVGDGEVTVRSGMERIVVGDECISCEDWSCSSGLCYESDRARLGSVEFRLSLGRPKRGLFSGFVHFESEGPVAVTPELFKVTVHEGATVTDRTEGTRRTVACSDNRGRDLLIDPVASGVRITVNTHATGALEDVWDVINEGGDTNVVRIVRTSRLGNVMSDETFVCGEDGAWTRTDHVSGIRETLLRADGLNDPADGRVRETRTVIDAAGLPLERTRSTYTRFGAFSNARLRMTDWESETADGVTNWLRCTYWDDPRHIDRHALMRLLWGSCRPWEYHDYDTRGFEILRVEQRNGSAVPSDFPAVVDDELLFTGGLADAFVTVYGYEPLTGDDAHRDETDRPRRETRYVVRNGRATCVGRTWHRYTHVLAGYPAVREETWRAASPASDVSDPANAYSSVTTYSHTEEGVPLVLRGEVAVEQSEDGVLSVHSVQDCGDVVRDVIRRSFGGSAFPTYEVVERDAVYGLEVRKATHLTDGDVLLDEEVSSYDEKNRLRSTVYSDGTSLTNAFSCCRKLWSRDREGRKTLRSAVTGQDRLYYAEEEVWLRELSTNGEHKVTQRLFDGLGRETNTVVYAAAAAGEAVDFDASEGRRLTSETTAYPNGGDDVSVAVDARGRKTVFGRREYEDRTETVESVFAAADAAEPDLVTLTTEWRNGTRVTEKAWEGKWTRETEWEDYDADGCEVRYEVTESSDCGTVTNRVTHSDFLGRTVREMTPNGTTETAYHGATEKANTTTVTAGEVTRISTALYNACGESVGNVQDGVTNRTETSYATDGGVWKVTRQSVAGSVTNSVTERREQLTGRESGVISRRIEIGANGVASETVERLGAEDGERVTVISNAACGVTTRLARYGVTLETATPDEARQAEVDALGRQVGETRCVDGVTATPCSETVYNAVGDVVERRVFTNETQVVAETFAYDTCGRRVSSVDALGNETVTRYDAVGNVVEQGGATYPVRYGYDTAGRRVSLSTTKDGRIWDVTRWTYDPATGKCIAKRYPDGSQVAYALTPDGLPLTTTKASGVWSRNVYDAKRQLIGTVSSGGAGNAAFAYDEFSRMIAASNGVAQIGYALHRGGIATNETVAIGAGEYELTRSVDEFGRIAGRGLVDGERTTIAYTAANRVEAVASAAVEVDYLYTDDGQDAGYQLTMGGTTVRREVTRDAYRRALVTAVSNFVNGVAVAGLRYGHDALSRVTARGRDEATDEFGYNEKGEVTYASINGWGTAYDYDLIGNFLSLTHGTNATIYAANALNQYTAAGEAALSYTPDGGLTGFGGLTFAYDSGSRLTSVSSNGVVIATYDYDAFDRRVRKVTPEAETTFVYDGWNLVLEDVAHTNGAVDRIEYVWGKDLSGLLDAAGGVGGLLYLKHNGAIYIPLYDANGSVIGYLDAAGNLVATFAYDAFGNSTVRLGPSPSPYIPRFRYSTKYLDPESGLYYYGYRFYSPVLARWLTRDPIEEQGGINLYGFCGNNAVGQYDVNGMFFFDNWLGAKIFWATIANGYMLLNGLDQSSRLLLRSLVPPGWDLNVGEGDALTDKVKRSKTYREMIQKIIKGCDKGKTSYKKSGIGVNFEGKDVDLDTAIGEASFDLDGTICRKEWDSAKVKLAVVMHDDYDFHYRSFKNVDSFKSFLVTAGNDVANIQQYMFVIHNYSITVSFSDHNRYTLFD